MFALRLAGRQRIPRLYSRSVFNFARKTPPVQTGRARKPDDDEPELFHLHSQSPNPGIRERGERIKKLASCPVCLHVGGERRKVKHECPECGWPTHCTHEHWDQDTEHTKYCTRL